MGQEEGWSSDAWFHSVTNEWRQSFTKLKGSLYYLYLVLIHEPAQLQFFAPFISINISIGKTKENKIIVWWEKCRQNAEEWVAVVLLVKLLCHNTKDPSSIVTSGAVCEEFARSEEIAGVTG